jgi:hypothetical protein
VRTTTRLVAGILALVSTVACSGAPAAPVVGSSAPVATLSGPASRSPAAPFATTAATPSATSAVDVVGSWTRTQSCEDQLADFEAKGLAKAEGFQWVTANWVPDPSPRTSGFCAGAIGPIPHSHFFTDDGAFGSRDENGRQVDDGNYVVASPGVLTFPRHASDFGYTGQIVVRYTVTGDQATFDVEVPKGCVKDPTCTEAYGWALSAFFKDGPWQRS